MTRYELGEETYRRENESFRDAGRVLSGVRDAQVMVAALAELTSCFADELPPAPFAGLKDRLAAEARAAHEHVQSDPQARAEMLRDLTAARGRVATWPLREQEDLRVLAPGLEVVYRRGRRALRRARKEPSTERLHELRKRAKDLWHAAQVLRTAAPKKMKKLARRAHDLSDIVGEDHDFAVLLETASARAETLAAGELELLTALVERRQAELQRRALKQARRLYRQRPRKLARRIPAAPATPS